MNDYRFELGFGSHGYCNWEFDFPTTKKPISKKRILTGKEIAKRKSKRDMTARSRKINRNK